MLVAAALAAALVALAACGDDDDGESGSRTDGAPGTAITQSEPGFYAVVNFDHPGLTVDVDAKSTAAATRRAVQAIADCKPRPERLRCRALRSQRWRCRADVAAPGEAHPETSVIC